MLKYLKFVIQKFSSSKFIVKGECKQCGQCCRNIVFMIQDMPVMTLEQFEKLKKWKKSYNNFFISGKDIDGALLFTCKSLGENNKCKDYKFRSLFCRRYPKPSKQFLINGGRPLDGCGYEFGVDKNFSDYL